MTTTTATRTLIVGQTCEHCQHTSLGVSEFENAWDRPGEVIVLCTDRLACVERQRGRSRPHGREVPA